MAGTRRVHHKLALFSLENRSDFFYTDLFLELLLCSNEVNGLAYVDYGKVNEHIPSQGALSDQCEYSVRLLDKPCPFMASDERWPPHAELLSS